MSSPCSNIRKNGVNANVTRGVMDRFYSYFLRYPESRPSDACIAIHLNPSGYAATARVAKCRIRKQWAGANVRADPLVSLTSTHRLRLRLLGGVPGPLLDAFLDAARSGWNTQDTWFPSSNQNRQINFRNQAIAIRILPSTRFLEVLCRKPGMTGLEVREHFRRVVVSTLQGRLPANHDLLHVANDLAHKLVPVERHRRFTFPASPYYKLEFYRYTLGLVIQHDLSERTNEQEVIETVPLWIPDLLQCIKQMASVQRENTEAVQENTQTLHEIKDLLLQCKLCVSGNAPNVTVNGLEKYDKERREAPRGVEREDA